MNFKSILLVDDEPDIRQVAELALSTVGDYDVYTAVDGNDGIKQARALQPDVILLDVMMPGLDGPGTYAALKEDPSTVDIPIIFMTAKSQTDEIEALMSLGAVGVISKPFDPMTLARQVEELLIDNA